MDDGYAKAGEVFGFFAALLTFIGVYVAAVGSVGWVVGIALGWIPASIAAAAAYAAFRFLWVFFLFAALWAWSMNM